MSPFAATLRTSVLGPTLVPPASGFFITPSGVNRRRTLLREMPSSLAVARMLPLFRLNDSKISSVDTSAAVFLVLIKLASWISNVEERFHCECSSDACAVAPLEATSPCFLLIHGRNLRILCSTCFLQRDAGLKSGDEL